MEKKIIDMPTGGAINTQAASNVIAKSRPTKYIISKVSGNNVELIPTGGRKKPVQTTTQEVMKQISLGTAKVVFFDEDGKEQLVQNAKQLTKAHTTNLTLDRTASVRKLIEEAVTTSVNNFVMGHPIVFARDEDSKGNVTAYHVEFYAFGTLQHMSFKKDKKLKVDQLKDYLMQHPDVEIINYSINRNAANPRLTPRVRDFGHGTLAQYRDYMLKEIKNTKQLDDVIESASTLSNSPTIKIIPPTSSLEERVAMVQKTLHSNVCLMLQQNPDTGVVKAYLGTTNLDVLAKIGYDMSTYAVHNLAQKYYSIGEHQSNTGGAEYKESVPQQHDKGTYQTILSCSLRARMEHSDNPEAKFELSTTRYGCYIENISAIITLGFATNAQDEWNSAYNGNYHVGDILGGTHLCTVSSELLRNIKTTIDKHATTRKQIGAYLLSDQGVQDIWQACRTACKLGGGKGLLANPNKIEYEEFKNTCNIIGHIYTRGGF